MEIFERTFQSVAGKDKLGKCSFKYFDEHFIHFIYGIILKNVPSNISGNILKYDTVCIIYKLLGKCSFKYFEIHFINFTYCIIL